MVVRIFYRFYPHAFLLFCHLGFPLRVYACEVSVPPELHVGGAVEAWARLDLGQSHPKDVVSVGCKSRCRPACSLLFSIISSSGLLDRGPCHSCAGEI